MKTIITKSRCQRQLWLSFILFITCLYSYPVLSQNLVISTIVRPPYSTDLYRYPDQVRVIVTSTFSTRASFFVHIKGDNGVDLRTSPDYVPAFVSISANEMNQFTGIDLSGYFDYNNLVSSGISRQKLADDGLPEGTYQICFRMKDDSGVFISGEEPLGCSNFFNIRYGDPPVTINPQCGTTLSLPGIQNIVFSWTPATGAPAWTQYTLRIVELLDSTQNPNAAMLTATQPPFFETTVYSGFSFFYGPSQTLLEKGHVYAWQVTAQDLESGTKFSNNGRSEVCWFKWNPVQTPLLHIEPQTAGPKKNEPKITTVTNVDPVPISVVRGTLNYKFKGSGAGGAVSQTSQQSVNIQNVYTIGGDGLIYNKDNISAAGSKPLANMKVSLVMTYVLKGKINNKNYDGQPVDMNDIREDNTFLQSYPDQDKILATTTTASDGSFNFQFMDTEPKIGVVDNNADWKSGGGEFYDHVSGKLYKVIRLKVENKYYCSPDINIKVEQWQALDLGTIVSYVKSYNLKVHTNWTTATFWDQFGGQGSPIDKVKTTIIRKYFVGGIPSDEGGYTHPGGPLQVTLLPKDLKTSNSLGDGTVTFSNLVQHDPDNTQDRYYILCEPNLTDALYIFKKKEKAYYPIYLKDKKDFPFNSLRFEITNSNMPATQDQAYGQDITWNSQLVVKTYETTMELYPDKPRIAGTVATKDVNAKPMSNITLMLLSNYKTSSNYNMLVRTAKTDSKGYFEFDNLDLEFDTVYTAGSSLTVTGPDRTLFCTPPGFKGMAEHIGVMKWGQQFLKDFFLLPDGLLTGYITDDSGKAVAADIQVDDLAFASTTMQLEYDQSGVANIGNTVNAGNTNLTIQATNSVSAQQVSAAISQIKLPSDVKQVFSINAPSGNDRKLKIIPKDHGYSSETYTVNVPKEINAQGNQPLKQYVVFRLKKRVRFIVAEKPAGNIYMRNKLKPVPAAEVTLKIPGADITQTTDMRGNVVFEFENNGSSFTFDIKPPDNADLQPESYTINNVQDGKVIVEYPPAFLKKATRITGKVSLGNDHTALKDATVYIDNGNGERNETKTDDTGNYILTGVPKDPANITVWASKPNSVPNIISQSKQMILKDVNKLDFTLQADNEIAIQDIYGFQVDIKNKAKQDDGTYLLTGALINLPANPNFKLTESAQTIPFANLKIKNSGNTTQSGIPIGIPAANDFETDVKDLSLVMNDVFGVLQEPSSGNMLRVSSENNKGQIKGKAGIMKTSFQYSGNYITFMEDEPLYLSPQPGSTQKDVVTLTVSDYPAKKFGITGPGGSDVTFKYLDFNAKGSKTTSWLEGNKIGLASVITTNNIPAMVPAKLSVDIGELVLKPLGIDPVTSNKALSFKLEQWDFQGPSWVLQQTKKGIYIPQGTIKTGLIDIPVKNMLITPDNFSVGEAEINNLTFSGVVPLNITTQNSSFGYNPSIGTDMKGHWELRIIDPQGAPAVTITGLPGMEPGSALKFQTFSLLSNGEQRINLGNQSQDLIFYKILKVHPLSFSGGDKYFGMSCNIDIGVPRIGPSSGVIKFSKPSSQVKFELLPFNVSFDGPGGVKFLSGLTQGDQLLDASGFTSRGVIKDQEGINLKGKLHRILSSAWLEVDPKGQVMPLGTGQTSLSNIEGKMVVDPNINDWSNFTFSGDMTGFKGMQSDIRKTFTVHGSITADNEKLGVKNIPSPFGGMSVTYDIQNARLSGNLNLDQQVGAMRINGACNFVVDGSGWYFLLGGQLTAPGFGNMAAGMLIGDYHQMAPDVVQKLMQFAYDKNVPASFQSGISGFFFTGQKDVPIINIPDFEINIGVLDAKLGLSAGLDGRVWMGFDNSGNEYGIGAMAYAHAWFSASSITCTKLSAEARAELGAKGTYNSNTGTFSVTGCGSFTVSGSAKQCFPTPCWDGICCKGCIGGGVSQGIKVDMTFDSTGKTSLDFGFGNCSGQSNMTGNW
jgi:hypothetical protein